MSMKFWLKHRSPENVHARGNRSEGQSLNQKISLNDRNLAGETS